jgi:outer membrane protein, multidrug efflux system
MRTPADWLRISVLAAVSLALAACAVGPTYRKPAQPQVAALNLADARFSTTAPRAQWWLEFSDTVLAELEARAVRGSPDLAVAVARVRAARAAFSESEFNLGPHVTLDGAYDRSKEQYPGFSTQRLDIENKSVGFDAAWEIDLFGHLRHQAAEARDRAEAEQDNLADAQVTLVAEVARDYFALRGTQRQLVVAHTNIDNEREALHLTQVRYEAGRVTELDTDSAQSRLKATEATVPLLEAQQKRYQYRLAVLLGVVPGALDADLGAGSVAIFTAPLPIGDPSMLLRNRSDVRYSERSLAAATEHIGVATADLFPKITFQGFVGFLAGDSGQLGKASTYAWSVAPTVSWPALDFGSVHARLRAAKADADGALAVYQKAVLVALEDFQNACANYGAQQSRLASVVEQAAASRRAADLAAIQYREGRINFLVLLDAQRTMLEAEDDLARAETDVNTGAVAVFKSLGGTPVNSIQLAQRWAGAATH